MPDRDGASGAQRWNRWPACPPRCRTAGSPYHWSHYAIRQPPCCPPSSDTENFCRELTRRPTHLAPADQMIMQMKNALSCVGPGVDDHAKPAFADPVLTRQPGGNLKNLADELGIVRFDVEQPGQVLARNDQKVHRRSRPDVLERDHPFVLVNNVRLCLAVDNRAEQTITHASLPARLLSVREFSRSRPAGARKSV